MASDMTEFGTSRFLLVVFVKDFVFSQEKTSLSQMKERVNGTIEGINAESLEKMLKNMNSRIRHLVRVDGGHMEQYYV